MPHEMVVDIALDRIFFGEGIRTPTDEQELSSLALNLRSNGQLQPARVRRVGEGYEVIFGARRILALKKAGFTHAACIVVDKELSEAEILQQQFSENAMRLDLNPLEFSRAVCRFMEISGLNGTEVAKALALSRTEISRCRAMVLDWDKELQQLVEARRICPSTGSEIHKAELPEKRQEMIQRALQGELTRDAASVLARKKHSDVVQDEKAHPSRLKVNLGGGVITVSGEKLTAESIISLLSKLLSRVRKLHALGLAPEAMLRELRNSSKAPK